MKCEEFEAIVDDLNRAGALDEATEMRARFHAGICEFCQARLAQAGGLTAALRAAAEDGIPAGAPDRVEAMLRSAFHREKWAVQRTRSTRRWAAAAIAATLLFGGALATRSWRKHSVTSRTESSRASGEKPVAPLNSSGAASGASSAGIVASDSGGYPDANPAADSQSPVEFTGDFLPYPAGGIPRPFENGEIVRVKLTGSSLSAMGYPVEGDRAGEAFTAQVLLGEDGQPRAIRFPRQ